MSLISVVAKNLKNKSSAHKHKKKKKNVKMGGQNHNHKSRFLREKTREQKKITESDQSDLSVTIRHQSNQLDIRVTSRISERRDQSDLGVDQPDLGVTNQTSEWSN